MVVVLGDLANDSGLFGYMHCIRGVFIDAIEA